MGFAAAAAMGGMMLASSMNKPASPQVPAAPQASQAPDAMGTRASVAGVGQGGGSPGIAQTFLSGAGGVDPSLLQLGRNTLLGGGGGGTAPTGMASVG